MIPFFKTSFVTKMAMITAKTSITAKHMEYIVSCSLIFFTAKTASPTAARSSKKTTNMVMGESILMNLFFICICSP